MVYIDDAHIQQAGWFASNMVANDKDELMEMAAHIGCKSEWVKEGGQYGRPYFEIAQTKKLMAMRLGAKEVTVRWLMNHFPVPLSVPDEELSIAQLAVRYAGVIFEDRNEKDTTVCVPPHHYRIPAFCSVDWFGKRSAELPLDEVKAIIAKDPDHFKPFILYT